MKLKQAAAVLAAGTLTLATAVSALAEAPQTIAQTSKDDVLSLPVQILDFNQDNLFFEYDDMRAGHMNFVPAEGAPVDGNGTAYAEGLVATPLNGTLTYTEDAQTRIARIVADEVATYIGKHADKTIFPQISANMTTGKKIVQDYLLGKDASDFANLIQWQATDDAPAGMERKWVGDNYVQVLAGADDLQELWRFEGDHLILPSDSTTVLTYTVTGLDATKTYQIGTFKDVGMQVSVTDASGASVPISFTIDGNDIWQYLSLPEGISSTTVTVSAVPGTDVHELWALVVRETDNGDTTAYYFADEKRTEWQPTTSFTDLHVSTEGNNVYGTIGHRLWHHDGDGVVCDDPSVDLTCTFDVNADSACKLNFWTDISTLPFTAKDSAGNELSITQNGGDFNFTAPSDGKVTLVLHSGEMNKKASILTLTSNPFVREGNDTEITSFASWNDLLAAPDLTAREYTAFMLSHLFTPTAGLNAQVPEYENLILRRQDDGSYLFDSTLPVAYDTKNKMLYNANEENGGEDRKGFFPLDTVNGKTFGLGQMTHTTQDRVNNDAEHNYHFTLRSGGTFVYRDGLYFDFSGDDDVYLFINNQLVLDLGGAHGAAEKHVSLDGMGLEKGKTYNFDFFYMERHTDASNLIISTNIDVQRRIDDASARVYQNVVFDLSGLSNPPEELYVQAYRDGEIYDAPMKFTPDALTRSLELEGGHDYTFTLLNYDGMDKYDLTITGETLTVNDKNGVTRTLTYTLREKGKDEPKPTDPGKPEQPTPAPAVTPAPAQDPVTPVTPSNPARPAQNTETVTATATPAPTAQAAAQSAAAQAAAKTPAQAASAIPQTEDASHPVLLCLLCVVSAFGFGIVLAKRYMRQ